MKSSFFNSGPSFYIILLVNLVTKSSFSSFARWSNTYVDTSASEMYRCDREVLCPCWEMGKWGNCDQTCDICGWWFWWLWWIWRFTEVFTGRIASVFCFFAEHNEDVDGWCVFCVYLQWLHFRMVDNWSITDQNCWFYPWRPCPLCIGPEFDDAEARSKPGIPQEFPRNSPGKPQYDLWW